QSQRHVQGDPSPHGVTHQAEPRGRQALEIAHYPLQVDRLDGGGSAMPAQVWRDHPIALWEPGDHRIPARASVRETVQENDRRRHLPIMTAIDTYRLLRVFCDELARCGLQHACTSPGS